MVSFEPVSFTPFTIPGKAVKPKYEGEMCHGINIIITDRFNYDSINTGKNVIESINHLYPDQFEWNNYIYKLWGNDLLLEYNPFDNGFKELSKKYYLYD